MVLKLDAEGSSALGLEPRRRPDHDTETGFPSNSQRPLAHPARALTLPEPSLSQIVGPVGPGEIVFLSGANDLLGAVAHTFLVEAVRERPEGGPAQEPARERRAVVIDGCNSISPYLVQRIARNRGLDAELLMDQIEVARAFTAHQLVTLLVQRLASYLARSPCDLLVILGVRDLFEDPDLGNAEARQLAAHAIERVRLNVRRHGVPCLITSSWPGKSANAAVLERSLSSGASRVVDGLSFDSMAGATSARRQSFAGENESSGARQRGLEEWGAMPARSFRASGRAPAALGSELWGAPARGPRGALRP